MNKSRPPFRNCGKMVTGERRKEGNTMSAQQLTYESVLELIRENSREARESSREGIREIQKMRRLMKKRDAEFDKIRQETALQIKETNKNVGKLGSRIGEIVEHMIGGKIVDKFRALGYEIKHYTRNHYFEMSKLGIEGEIDLILHDGDISILIEVKTSLGVAEVMQHMEKMEKYRVYANANPIIDSSVHYLGAVAGAVVKDDAIKFAHENGLYTIVQSGEAVEIVPTPEGFKAREW
jgi:hypothetical protein